MYRLLLINMYSLYTLYLYQRLNLLQGYINIYSPMTQTNNQYLYHHPNSSNLATQNERRSSSISSRNDSANKFLKRKPDHKKIIEASKVKKRKQSISDHYFDNQVFFEQQSSSKTPHIEKDNFIICEKYNENDGKQVSQYQDLSFLSSKSERSMLSKKKQLGQIIRKMNIDIDPDYKQIKPSAQQNPSVPQNQLINTKLKKSKYKSFINHYDFLSFEDKNKSDDQYQLNSTRQNGQLSKQYRKIKEQHKQLNRKYKQLQNTLLLSTEKEMKLKIMMKILQDELVQKDNAVLRVQRQLQSYKNKCWELDNVLNKNEEVAMVRKQNQNIKVLLKNEEQRIMMLKEENDFLQNQLVLKNQELLQVYGHYTDLELRFAKGQKETKKTFKKMQKQIIILRSTMKNVAFQQTNSATNLQTQRDELQLLKKQISKHQQQIKYLHIQNQCLLIKKEQLIKSQNENRKLKQQRDYFKFKIMQNIKNNRRRQFCNNSNTSNTSILFELSQLSIQKL